MTTPFRIALQLLTRIPVTTPTDITPQQQGMSLLYYPIVGLIIGAVLYGVMYFITPISNVISAAIALTIWVLITGGLHLDGLADSADAWLGGTKANKDETKKRSFEIMKDPNCGPAGVFWIVLILLLKFAALTEITHSTLFVIVVVPVIGRALAVLLFLITPYVSQSGIASTIAQHIPRKLAYGMLLAIVVLLSIVNFYSLVVLLSAVIVMLLLRYLMLNRLNGMTGDTTGALIEITEAVAIITSILIFNIML